jgi:hypothetical protein
MRRIFVPLFLICAGFLLAPLAALAVTIPTVPVGNPGNPTDPTTGFGSVDYAFNIGTYDVTVSQYVEFLNAKDANGTNPLGLWNDTGSLYSTYGGISFSSAADNGSKYGSISGRGDLPVN